MFLRKGTHFEEISESVLMRLRSFTSVIDSRKTWKNCTGKSLKIFVILISSTPEPNQRIRLVTVHLFGDCASYEKTFDPNTKRGVEEFAYGRHVRLFSFWKATISF